MAIWPFERGCFVSDWLAPCGALVFLPVSIHPQRLNSAPRSQLVLVLQSRCCPLLGPCTVLWPDLQPTAGKMLSAGHLEQVLLMTHTYGFIFIQFETHWACDSSHTKPVCFFSASIFVYWKSKKWEGLRFQSINQLGEECQCFLYRISCLLFVCVCACACVYVCVCVCWGGIVCFFLVVLTFSTVTLIQINI